MTMGVVRACPHVNEKEDVDASIPNEFGEAGKGYEDAMHGFSDRLLLKSETNLHGRKPTRGTCRE